MDEEKTLLKMVPRDLVFCRDARPMEESWNGSGGFLPGPTTFHGAVLAEYYRRFPGEMKLRESERISSSLRTWGPFLGKDDELFFPTPLDVTPGSQLLKVRNLAGDSDLPSPLRYGLFAPKADKKSVEKYISCSELSKYLKGDRFALTPESELYDREARPGITISPESRTAAKGKYYFAEYLRLRPGIALNGSVSMKSSDGKDDVSLAKLFDLSRTLPLGGQQTIMYVEAWQDQGVRLPAPQVGGTRVKWVLLTPALWTRGWLPDFVNDDPDAEWNLSLRATPAVRPPREPGETRTAYRERIRGEEIPARLVAARVGKPQPISGWKLAGSGGGMPRATRLLVPAGSVFYFEARDEEAARLLVQALHGRTLSNFGGTSGLGLGVCGTFEIERQ